MGFIVRLFRESNPSGPFVKCESIFEYDFNFAEVPIHLLLTPALSLYAADSNLVL